MTKQALPPPPGDRPSPSAPPRPPSWRHWLWPIAIGLSLVLWIVLPAVHGKSVPTDNLTYSQFLSDVDAHQVKTVHIDNNGKTSGALTNGHNYNTVIPGAVGRYFCKSHNAVPAAPRAGRPRPPSLDADVPVTGSRLIRPAL